MPPASPSERALRCPRCGFDQRGPVATWTTACPLEGRCAECGLSFAWADLFSHGFKHPRWCVEGDGRWRSFPVRCLATLGVSLWPWRFWSSLRMFHAVRWGRLAAGAATVLVLLYIGFALVQAVMSDAEARRYVPAVDQRGRIAVRVVLLPFSDRAGFLTPVVPYPDGAGGWIFSGGFAGGSPRDQIFGFWLDDDRPAALATALALHALCPLGFLLLPVSRRRAKVRWAHIGRIAAYGLGLLVPWFVSCGLYLALTTHGLWSVGTGLWWVCFAWGWGQPLLLAVWWATATGRYLEMPHAWGVGVGIVAMVGLLLVLLLVLGGLVPADVLVYTLG